MTDGLRLCLVGLPATGKTTFIAALWGYLTSGLAEGNYRVTQWPDNPKYLNEITQAWIAGRDMPRSSLSADERIDFTVETPSGSLITVVLPDLPGEVFRNAVLRPSIDEAPADAVQTSDLLLLFVNGEKARTYEAIGDHEVPPERENAEEEHSGGELQAHPAASSPAAPSPVKDFAIEDLDSDTLNSELLQRLIYLTREHRRPPVLVVVAAWDAHAESGITPPEWLAQEQPMLSQILDELGRTVPVGVMGVSAQGANYGVDPDVTKQNANERPWAQDSEGTSTDIAGPLLWYENLGRANE